LWMHRMAAMPVLMACTSHVFFQDFPANRVMLVRASSDGAPLRVVTQGPAFVNPLTETAEFLELSRTTVHKTFRGIETTVGTGRVRVGLKVVMDLDYGPPGSLTPEVVDWLLSAPHEAVVDWITGTVEARLREACINWTPDGLRANLSAVTDWVQMAAATDLAPSGLVLYRLVILEVDAGQGHVEYNDGRGPLLRMRAALIARGIDPGPEPPGPLSLGELSAEIVRLDALMRGKPQAEETKDAQDGGGA